MTSEVRTKLAKLKAEAEKYCVEYNGVISGTTDKAAARSILAIENDIETALSEYNTLAQNAKFDELLEAEDPMMQAVLDYEMVGIAAKSKKDSTTKIETKSIVDKSSQIDLLKLAAHTHTTNPDGQHSVGHGDWVAAIQKLNYLYTKRAIVKTHANIDDSVIKAMEDNGYTEEQRNTVLETHVNKALAELDATYKMSEAAAQYDLGNEALSNNNIRNTYYKVFEEMFGKGVVKPNADLIAYTDLVWGKKEKCKPSVKASSHSEMTMFLMDMANAKLTGRSIAVSYKTKK